MKRYDRAYFERWYRHPRHRIACRSELDRRVRMAVAVTEFLLDRPLRSVLDVGCGEGAWRPAFGRIRPAASYIGVDPSEYAIRRFGRRRNLRLGSIADLDRLGLAGPFDLIVCADVLHYLTPADVRRGVRQIAGRLGGVAFLEVQTGADDVMGDLRGFRRRPPTFYRRLFGESGLTPCAPHCYIGPALRHERSPLEWHPA